MTVIDTGEIVAKYRHQYSTAELLKLALTMLDVAAEENAHDEKHWLHDNKTVAVIRDRVANPSRR